MTVANAALMPDDFQEVRRARHHVPRREGQVALRRPQRHQGQRRRSSATDFKKSDFRFRRTGNHMTDFFECIVSREECIAPVNAGHRSASIGHLGKLACTLGSSASSGTRRTRRNHRQPALNGLLTRKYRGDWKLEA
jgi:hypothetical protein